MKQCITVEQLKALSDLEIKFLSVYNGFRNYDSNTMWSYVATETTIGKIMSFLYKLGELDFTYDADVFAGVCIDLNKWVVYNISDETMAEADELVDALWMAFTKALRSVYEIEGD